MAAASRSSCAFPAVTAADDLEPIVILDDEATIADVRDQPSIDARLLHDVVAYAQTRVAAGEAAAALQLVGADHPALVAAYHLGYLPRSWQDALGTAARRAFAGRRLADTLVLPAFDVQGNVVDLLAIHARAQGGAYVGLCDPPRGLLAPRVATTHAAVTVTDSLRVVARCFGAGRTDMVLLRGVADAEANASRLHAAGVRHVLVRTRINAEAIATALRAAGIAVAVVSAHPQWDGVGYDAITLPVAAAVSTAGADIPPAVAVLPADTADDQHAPGAVPTVVAPHDGLRLISHDRQSERATFTIGAITYVVEVPHEVTNTRVEVVIRHVGQVHREVVDLAIAAACARFAGNAALRCGLTDAVIAAHLPLLLAEVQSLHQVQSAPPPDHGDAVPPGVERDDALALLRAPDLLDRLVADMDALGWVGEDAAKRVLLLTAISRKLPEPLWAIRTASSDLTGSHGVDVIAAITPPEDVLHVSRLSGAALAYQDEQALSHKLLVIDDATALSAETLLALRVLHHRGALSQAIVPRHNLSGSARTQTNDVRGPIAVLSATAGVLDQTLTTSCCVVPVDESPDQTARVLAAERRRYAAPALSTGGHARTAIGRRHHTLQRLIARRPVVIPFADRIQFPATTLRSRSAQARFLALIAASALLHQHQRLRDQDHVVADLRDFELAVSLAPTAGIGVEHDHGLGRPAVVLLTALQDAHRTSFTADDVRALLPHWSRTSFRSAVADLMRSDYVTSPAGGRGTARRYEVVPSLTQQRMPAITLDRVTTVAQLASWSGVGQWPTSQLNSRPHQAIDAVG